MQRRFAWTEQSVGVLLTEGLAGLRVDRCIKRREREERVIYHPTNLSLSFSLSLTLSFSLSLSLAHPLTFDSGESSSLALLLLSLSLAHTRRPHHLAIIMCFLLLVWLSLPIFCCPLVPSPKGRERAASRSLCRVSNFLSSFSLLQSLVSSCCTVARWD